MGLFSRDKPAIPAVETYSSLKLRLDCIIDINLYKILVHNDYLIFNDPGTSHQVTHVASAVYEGLDVNRFYINSMDDEGESMLYVASLPNNPSTNEIILFRELDTVFPEDEDSWIEWMGDDDGTGLLSEEFFAMTDDDGQEIIYQMESEISPYDVEFNVTPAKSQNEEPYDMKTSSSLFKRNIAADDQPEFFEYLLVSVEDEERVTLYAGIEVTASQITVN